MSARILQTQIDKYCPHVVALVHFHDRLNQKTCQVFVNFHTHTVEEAYCPSHQLQQLEAVRKKW